MPHPSDDYESLIGDPKFIIWKPVKRSDISWNFEKFLIDQSGKPVKRFSKSFQTCNIDKDIDKLLSQKYLDYMSKFFFLQYYNFLKKQITYRNINCSNKSIITYLRGISASISNKDHLRPYNLTIIGFYHVFLSHNFRKSRKGLTINLCNTSL